MRGALDDPPLKLIHKPILATLSDGLLYVFMLTRSVFGS